MPAEAAYLGDSIFAKIENGCLTLTKEYSDGTVARLFLDSLVTQELRSLLAGDSGNQEGFEWSPAIKRARRNTPRGGCGAALELPNNADWEFCGQIRHPDQMWAPLCKECGGGYNRSAAEAYTAAK